MKKISVFPGKVTVYHALDSAVIVDVQSDRIVGFKGDLDFQVITSFLIYMLLLIIL